MLIFDFSPQSRPYLQKATIKANTDLHYRRGQFITYNVDLELWYFHAWHSPDDFADPHRLKDGLDLTNRSNHLVPYILPKTVAPHLQELDQAVVAGFQQLQQSDSAGRSDVDAILPFYIRSVSSDAPHLLRVDLTFSV